MVLCNVDCVQKISKYLEVLPGNLHVSENNIVAANDLVKNESIEGFSTIVQALVRNSEYQDTLGKDALTQALTRQWLEYAILYVNYADNPTNARRILKELNAVLKNNTYICGTEKTIADVALYYVLHSIMQGLTIPERAECINVSRWFDNIQQDHKLRQKLDRINFNLLHLYL